MLLKQNIWEAYAFQAFHSASETTLRLGQHGEKPHRKWFYRVRVEDVIGFSFSTYRVLLHLKKEECLLMEAEKCTIAFGNEGRTLS